MFAFTVIAVTVVLIFVVDIGLRWWRRRRHRDDDYPYD